MTQEEQLQDHERRIANIEARLGIGQQKWRTFVTLGDGTKETILYPYSQVLPTSIGFYGYDAYVYCEDFDMKYRATRNGGLSTSIATSAPYGTVYRRAGTYYASNHVWKRDSDGFVKPFSRYYVYGSGGWNLVGEDFSPTGEDRSIFYDKTGGKFVMFVRRNPYNERLMGIKAATTFEQLKDAAVTQYSPSFLTSEERLYSFSACEINDRIYGVGNILNVNTNMVFAVWYRLPQGQSLTANLRWERLAYMPSTTFDANDKQLFITTPNVVGTEEVVIGAIRSASLHAHDNYQPPTKHYSSIHTMKVPDFVQWVNAPSAT